MFTQGGELKKERKDCTAVMNLMPFNYLKQKTEAEIIQDAFYLRFSGSDAQNFLREAEKLCTDAGSNNMAQYWLLMKAIETDRKMIEFVLVLRDDTFDKVRK